MESFVQGMEPLVQIDEVMGTQRWVMITARGPLLHKLTTKHLNTNKSDSRLVKAMKCAMLSKLQDPSYPCSQIYGTFESQKHSATAAANLHRTLR